MATTIRYKHLEVDRIPKAGDTIALPIGLHYENEFFGTSHVTLREHIVTIVGIDRDEVFWKIRETEKCFARWKRRA